MRFVGHTLLLAMLCTATVAAADPIDTLGVSWSGRGTAGACTASTDGPVAATYNPSLLGNSGASAVVGLAVLYDGLNPNTPEVDTLQAFVEAGLALPVADFGDFGDLWVGLTALTPARSLYDIDLLDDQDPTWLTFGTRERRLSLSAAAAWNLFGFAGIGAGFELLPTVSGGVTADLTDAAGHNEFHVNVGYRLSPTAGLFIHVHPSIRIGVNYRAENKTRIDLPVDVDAEGLHLAAAVSAQTYYVPHRLHVGIEAVLPFALSAEANLGWYHYSGFPLPSPTVTLYDEEGNGTPDPATTLALQDVFSPSLSIKFAGPVAAALGYRFVMAATEQQTTTTNILDAHRHQLSAGLRIPIPGVAAIGMSALFVTADCSVTWLQERRDYKETLLFDNPGYPQLAYGGYRLTGGLGLEVAY